MNRLGSETLNRVVLGLVVAMAFTVLVVLFGMPARTIIPSAILFGTTWAAWTLASRRPKQAPAQDLIAAVNAAVEDDRVRLAQVHGDYSGLVEAVAHAGRVAGIRTPLSPGDATQIVLTAELLGEAAVVGMLVTRNVEALIHEATENAPNAWISAARVHQAIAAAAREGVPSRGLGAAGGLLALVGQVGEIALDLGLEMPRELRLDTSAKLKAIAKLAAMGRTARVAFLRTAIRDVLSPAAKEVSTEWIVEHVNQHLAVVEPDFEPVTPSEIDRILNGWGWARRVQGTLWSLQ